VKSFNGNPVKHDFTISQGNLEALRAFARLYGVELYVAVYWVMMNMWTLVPADAFQPGSGKRMRLPLDRAARANNMRLRGDIMVGTEFPLSWVLTVDEARAARKGNEFLLTITGDFFESNGRRILDPVEQKIAWYLAYYGDWDTEGPGQDAQFDGDKLVRIETALYPNGPRAQLDEQGFAFIGFLSSMYSKFYRDAVTDDEGKVKRLRLETAPGFLGRLIPEPYHGKALKLWRMELAPSWPNKADGEPEKVVSKM
jgi:hypothetical protein